MPKQTTIIEFDSDEKAKIKETVSAARVNAVMKPLADELRGYATAVRKVTDAKQIRAEEVSEAIESVELLQGKVEILPSSPEKEGFQMQLEELRDMLQQTDEMVKACLPDQQHG